MAGDVVIREGRGGRVWDEDGKEYVDFLLGSGPMLVGHAHPEVTAAAQARIAQGTTFFANNRWGIELAEAIVEARALRRAGALRLDRVGGRPLRDARRARLHQARQDPQIRGRLSRHERLFADEPGAEALGQFPGGGARFRRHPAQLARRDADRAVQQHRGGRGHRPRASRRIGRRSSSNRSSASSRRRRVSSRRCASSPPRTASR